MLHKDIQNQLENKNLNKAIEIILRNIRLGEKRCYSPLSFSNNINDEILETTPIQFFNDYDIERILHSNTSINNFNFMLMELLDTKFVFIDTETTGLENARPVQITIVITDVYLNVIEAKNFYKYQDNIEPEAMNVHRLTPEFLSENETSAEEIFKYFEYINSFSSYKFIGQNVQFDINTMKNFYLQHGKDWEEIRGFHNPYCIYKVTDIATTIYPALKSKKLVNIIQYLNLHQRIVDKTNEIFNATKSEAHDSRYDTVALLIILEEFYKAKRMI